MRNKLAIAVIFSPLAATAFLILKDARRRYKNQKRKEFEINARNHATFVALRLWLEGEINSKKELDEVWQFAYMTYGL